MWKNSCLHVGVSGISVIFSSVKTNTLMTTIELNAMRCELAREILNVESGEILQNCNFISNG